MVKPVLVVTAPARGDIKAIKLYSRKIHGRSKAKAYDDLIARALRDLQDDPLRLGSKPRPDIAQGLYTYHIRMSRKATGPTVASPRHLVLYFQPRADRIVISRILHDARDLPRHMPDDHRKAMQQGAVPEAGTPPPKDRL